MKLKNPVILSDCLYNASRQCTGVSRNPQVIGRYSVTDTNEFYGRGCINGAVGALMATGLLFDAAWTIVKAHLPADIDEACIPKSWRNK